MSIDLAMLFHCDPFRFLDMETEQLDRFYEMVGDRLQERGARMAAARAAAEQD